MSKNILLEKYMNNVEMCKCVTENEVIKLFQDEFKVYMNDYNSYEIQYCNFENDNYKVKGGIDRFGGEGQGEERWEVSKVIDKRTNEVFFIQFSGYYNSWDGTDWSGNYWSIVKPIVVEVIRWN